MEISLHAIVQNYIPSITVTPTSRPHCSLVLNETFGLPRTSAPIQRPNFVCSNAKSLRELVCFVRRETDPGETARAAFILGVETHEVPDRFAVVDVRLEAGVSTTHIPILRLQPATTLDTHLP